MYTLSFIFRIKCDTGDLYDKKDEKQNDFEEFSNNKWNHRAEIIFTQK